MSDAVNHPSHYGGKDNPYEAIKVIEAWKLPYHLGDAVAYIARWDKKGDTIENLEKAAWFINRFADQLRKERDAAGRKAVETAAAAMQPYKQTNDPLLELRIRNLPNVPADVVTALTLAKRWMRTSYINKLMGFTLED